MKVWWAKGYKATEGKNCGWDNEGEKGEVQVVAVHSYETDALYAGMFYPLFYTIQET